MKVQSCLLSAAIASALVVASPASAVKRGVDTTRGDAVAARARTLLGNHAVARLAQAAAADEFVPGVVFVDADGTEHVRFQRLYQGLPMIGGDLVMHSRNGQVAGVSQTLATSERPGVLPAINSGLAIVNASADFGTPFTAPPGAQKVVYARGPKPVLAYEVTLAGVRADQTPSEMHYIIDAGNGAILAKWDAVHTARPGRDKGGCADPVDAVGVGNSLLEGTVALATSNCGSSGFQLVDNTRGGGSTTNMGMRQNGMGSVYSDGDNTWGNGALNDAATVAVDAHYGISVTWDYYLDRHEREGIADDGVGAISRVHYGRNYANAFWRDSCFCMTFGDGDNGVTTNPLVALDIAGHEMSHGVTSHSAGLVYEGESGGLNEANSDIFGTMVEYYANNPADPVDYLIGENIYANNPGYLALRYMFKPSLDGLSPDCYIPELGDMDVHYNSGVANHFYYLLAEGAVVPEGFGADSQFALTPGDLVCDGNTTLAGIGREAAEKIWYRALTVYMTSDTDYAGARAATLSAAEDLYGAGSAQALGVAAAWNAVSVM
ncbi:MAG: M4 family metallopeptidase [Pseudomonadota bacterium]|nr:M4 family metallopeptidase [Pseudomonadota bacterium]